MFPDTPASDVQLTRLFLQQNPIGSSRSKPATPCMFDRIERIDEEGTGPLNADIHNDLKETVLVQEWDPATFESAHKLIKTERNEESKDKVEVQVQQSVSARSSRTPIKLSQSKSTPSLTTSIRSQQQSRQNKIYESPKSKATRGPESRNSSAIRETLGNVYSRRSLTRRNSSAER